MYSSNLPPTGKPPVRIKLKNGYELTMGYEDFIRELQTSIADPAETTSEDLMIIQPQPTSHPPAPLPEDVYRLQTSRLAGYHHYGQDAWLHQMKPGDQLTLVVEPANPHDKYAVRVHWQDKHIGYLPRSSNHVVSRLLRQNAPLRAIIAWLDPQQDQGTPMTLHVLAPKF